jgi:predicted dinucleotide-binding enzyme
MSKHAKTMGIIGSGHIGSQLARLATSVGYDVVLSNSRGPETLADLVAELGPKASAATAADAAAAGDVVVVTVPLGSYRDLPAGPLAGKTVIDTCNYYPQRDGRIPELDDESTTTSELIQAQLPGARVVKAFNNIYFADLTTDGKPAGTPGRRALTIAGDDTDAKRTVTSIIDEFGFDVVDAGPLARAGGSSATPPRTGCRPTPTACAKHSARRNATPKWRSAPPDQEGSALGCREVGVERVRVDCLFLTSENPASLSIFWASWVPQTVPRPAPPRPSETLMQWTVEMA